MPRLCALAKTRPTAAGRVDVEDLLKILGSFGSTNAPFDPASKGKSQGVIDVEDLLAVLATFGKTGCTKAPPLAMCDRQHITLKWAGGHHATGHALFGAAKFAMPHTSIVIANPLTGCKGPALANGGLVKNSMKGKIALIRRGTCYFSDKVEAAQKAGAVGVIIYNNVAGSVTMAAKPGFKPASVTIPSVFIQKKEGDDLYNSVKKGMTTASLQCPPKCPKGHRLTWKKTASHNGKYTCMPDPCDRQHITLKWAGGHHATGHALFGSTKFGLPHTPVVIANPLSGCKGPALANGGLVKNSMKGKIALIRRGTCYFSDKVEAAQKAGAVGVIIYNNVAGSVTMAAKPGYIGNVKIPSVFIQKKEGDDLYNSVKKGMTTASLQCPPKCPKGHRLTWKKTASHNGKYTCV
jgi:hypothetical protein